MEAEIFSEYIFACWRSLKFNQIYMTFVWKSEAYLSFF